MKSDKYFNSFVIITLFLLLAIYTVDGIDDPAGKSIGMTQILPLEDELIDGKD